MLFCCLAFSRANEGCPKTRVGEIHEKTENGGGDGAKITVCLDWLTSVVKEVVCPGANLLFRSDSVIRT